jgi:hypothetical protein
VGCDTATTGEGTEVFVNIHCSLKNIPSGAVPSAGVCKGMEKNKLLHKPAEAAQILRQPRSAHLVVPNPGTF